MSFYIVMLSSFSSWLQGIKVLLQFFWPFFFKCLHWIIFLWLSSYWWVLLSSSLWSHYTSTPNCFIFISPVYSYNYQFWTSVYTTFISCRHIWLHWEILLTFTFDLIQDRQIRKNIQNFSISVFLFHEKKIKGIKLCF